MAEDLSIKLKVEPDGGDVQGKLDKIAKDKKFNVQIGDKNLKTQLNNITKKISNAVQKSLDNYLDAMGGYSKKIEQAQAVIEQAQKREETALISSVNLLAKNAKERQEITDTIKGQTAAQKQLNNEVKLTFAQESNYNARVKNSTEIQRLEENRKKWKQLGDTISNVKNIIAKNSPLDEDSELDTTKISKNFSAIQKEMQKLMSNESFSEDFKNVNTTKKYIENGISLIEQSLDKGTASIQQAVDKFQDNLARGIFYDFQGFIQQADETSIGDYVKSVFNKAGVDSDEAIKDFSNLISADVKSSSGELKEAYTQYATTLLELFDELENKFTEIATPNISENRAKELAVEFQSVVTEIASVIGVLPKSIKDKTLKNIDAFTQDTEDKIQQSKEKIRNSIVQKNQTDKIKLNVDISDEQTEEKIKNTSEYIIDQLTRMKTAQEAVTNEKGRTLKAEQYITEATGKSITGLMKLVEQKEQIADRISKLKYTIPPKLIRNNGCTI